MSSDRRNCEHRRHLVALLLLVVCGALLWTSERNRTLVVDEPLHLIRGHAYWWTHDTHLSYAHPPLANLINTAPYALRGRLEWGRGAELDGSPRDARAKLKVPPDSSRAQALPALSGWSTRGLESLSNAYFRHDFGTARAELVGARRMTMLWTLSLGLFLYLWSLRRWGWPTAILSLALYSVHPTLLAHGRSMTTDMPLAALTFVSLAALISWIERPRWGRAALFGLAATGMVLTKHSGLGFVVVMSAIVLGAAALGHGGFGGVERRGRQVALVVAQLVVVALFMTLAIDAIYGFDRVGLSVEEILAQPEPTNWISRAHEGDALEHSPIARLPGGLRLPFPYTWLTGLGLVSGQNAMGHGRFFFGMNESAGHPLYFPAMLFAKSPTGLLVLLALAAWLAFARLRTGTRPSVASSVLIVFAGATLAIACASRINIGVRHVLFEMPIMVVLAARAGHLLIAGEPSPGVPIWLAEGRRAHAIVGACLLGGALGAAWTFPAWLGDFNVLVGGPAGGHRMSVVGEDWGQDLGDLAELAEAKGWERITYHTTFPLRREELVSRGLRVEQVRCKQVVRGPEPLVLHLSDWLRRPQCFQWLGDSLPDHIVNHHLLVFDPPRARRRP